MWEIAENLHRADLTELERSNHIAEWIRLCDVTNKPGQVAQVSAKGGRGQEGGVSGAARDLGIERTEARRAVKIDALAPEAKAEAVALGLDDNQRALLKAADEPDAEAQVKSLQDHAAAKAAAKSAPRPATAPTPAPAPQPAPSEPRAAPVAPAVTNASEPAKEAVTNCGPMDRDEHCRVLIDAWTATGEWDIRIEFLKKIIKHSLTSKRFAQFAEWFEEYRSSRNDEDGAE
jgi:ParB family chromosome partitioning protein